MLTGRTNRRTFIAGLGAAAAWPMMARAQQPERVRRIGVLTTLAENDPEAQSRNTVLLQGLQQLGWTVGHNVQIDYRTGLGDMSYTQIRGQWPRLRRNLIMAIGTEVTASLLQVTRTVPIVFVLVPDPVSAGFVDSLARPGRNITGFTSFEYGISAKWLELLKEIAPSVIAGRGAAGSRRAPRRTYLLPSFEAATLDRSGTCAPSRHRVHSDAEIEAVITAFSHSTLIVGSSCPWTALSSVHRDLIIALAAQNELPAVYFQRFFVTGGGLLSYGPDFLDQYRRAVGYVDRILKGEKPAEFPVQVPTNYQLAINLKTAKALGLNCTALATRPRRRGDRMRRRAFIGGLGGRGSSQCEYSNQ